ncbi:MAG: class I adenylate-forming enzyme family protein [Rickettsiaceae bacterium]
MSTSYSSQNNVKITGEKICSIASYLNSLGINSQDRIAVIMDNSVETVMLYIACLYLRVVVCPINPDHGEIEVRYCIDLVKPKKIFTNKGNLSYLKGTILFDNNILNSLLEAQELHKINYRKDDIFCITFSSGTTGKPKAIIHKAETLLSCADVFNKFTYINEYSVFFHVMPMFYMAGILNSILCPLVAGAKLVIGNKFGPLSPLSFWNVWLMNQINTTWLSPSMVYSILKLDRSDSLVDTIREFAESYKVFVGTATLSPELKLEFKKRYNINLIESYGLSEVLFVSVENVKNNYFTGSVGNILPGVNIEISPANELEIKSDYNMYGYLKENGDILSCEKFSTGDIGTIVENELFITGRVKDLIIKGGVNISPRKIESIIEGLDKIEQVAVIGCKDEFYGENIACFFVGQLTEQELNEYCLKKLAPDHVPVKFIKRQELQVGPTGKIKKHELKKFLV